MNTGISSEDKIQDPEVYGLFPEFKEFIEDKFITKAAEDLLQINNAVVNRILNTVPNEWKLDQPTVLALKKFIVERAQFVAKEIAPSLIVQNNLPLE